MNVAMSPVEGSGQDGVENQEAWPERSAWQALPGQRSCFQLGYLARG